MNNYIDMEDDVQEIADKQHLLPIKVWLDDKRKMPNGFDYHARTAEECIELISKNRVSFISLDNDLGEGYTEGKRVAQFIEKSYIMGEIEYVDFVPHTDNPVAMDEIIACKRSIIKFRK